MSCGFVGLSRIYSPIVALDLNEQGDYFRGRLQNASKGTKMVITGVGAVLTVHFLDNGLQPVRATDIENHTIPGLKKLFWYWCLSRGFWITERGMLSIILGTIREEIDSYVQTVQDFVEQHIDLVKI